MSIATLLEMSADAFGDRIAITAPSARVTYAEMLARARAAAHEIRDSGAAHVAFIGTNHPAGPVALFAAALAGRPYVPLNYRLTKPEIAALLSRIEPAFVIAGETYREGLDLKAHPAVVTPDAFVAGSRAAAEFIEPPDSSAIAALLFTSGTTGTPKAAVLRHDNLLSYILGTVEFGSADEREAGLTSVPPYHIAGISSILSSTYSARRSVQLESFSPEAWLDAVKREGVTNAFVVPTMLGRIVDHLETRGGVVELPSLRAIAYGGGKMPLSTITRAMQLFPGVDFTNAYGLTETSSTICLLDPEDHRQALKAGGGRLASVGRPLPHIELEIRDEQGARLPNNRGGLVYVRGGQVSGEYRDQGTLLDKDGWFSTRDRGYLDDEGYLFLEGRADDVIVRGGENISPGEIEDVLLQHPAVADVAVVAIPDEEWGEGVGAAVVLKPGADVTVEALQSLVREKLRSSRVPQIIRFKSALPYNETGKVLRRVIRQEFEQDAKAAPSARGMTHRAAADYARALLHDLDVAASVEEMPELHPAALWSQCGLMALTGAPDKACLLPAAIPSAADGALRALQALAPRASLATLSGSELLCERAALMGLRRSGAVSPGGSCRLLRARQGLVALNLARASDWELLPALFEEDRVSSWDDVTRLVRGRDANELVSRGRMLGLALAVSCLKRDGTSWRRLAAKGSPRAKNRPPVIVDLSALWAGPLCTHLLGLLGARVIKVEDETRPDGARRGNAAFYDLLNAGKESVALDLRSEKGRDVLRTLIAQADIVVESARPRALRQWGIDAEAIVAAQPGLTWVSITGYGRRAPEQDWIAFGDDAGVAAGLSAILEELTGEPLFCGDAVADPLTGIHAALGAYANWRSGGGALIDIALADVARHALHFDLPQTAEARRGGWEEWTRLAGVPSPPTARAVTAKAAPLGVDTHRVLSEIPRGLSC